MCSLQSLLKNRLEKGTYIQLYHLQVPSALDVKLKHVRHLLLAVEGGFLIYAAEIIVYLTPRLSTIYVSKVDSTGCHAPAHSTISELTVSFLQYLTGLYKNDIRFTLFARSQPQYIFPCSSQNTNKHILDDKNLVKWWIKTYEKIRSLLADTKDAHGYVLIPGFGQIETQHYLPTKDHWTIGHPYDPKACVEKQILSFPDDPKARFLDQLRVERRLNQTTVADFWEQMAYRQEMSLGHTIGFLTLDVQQKASTCPKENGNVTDACSLDSKTFQFVLCTIQNETYSSAAETKAATSKLLHVLAGITSVAVIEVYGEKLDDRKADLLASPSNTRSIKNDPSESVNILQPRKKVKKVP